VCTKGLYIKIQLLPGVPPLHISFALFRPSWGRYEESLKYVNEALQILGAKEEATKVIEQFKEKLKDT
jgi:hypothetical protein